MSKYYLHDGSENSGPFTIEELKQNKITRNTPIWYEGIDDCKEAGTIEELKSLFPVIIMSISNPGSANKKSNFRKRETKCSNCKKEKSLYEDL